MRVVEITGADHAQSHVRSLFGDALASVERAVSAGKQIDPQEASIWMIENGLKSHYAAVHAVEDPPFAVCDFIADKALDTAVWMWIGARKDGFKNSRVAEFDDAGDVRSRMIVMVPSLTAMLEFRSSFDV